MDSSPFKGAADFACGDARLAQRLFTSGAGHIPVEVTSVADSLPVWINDRASASYEHITQCCAYRIASPGTGRDAVEYRATRAVADRYGGEGSGGHGGSGRAAILGTYHVKGIGPTPLIGQGASIYHRDGLASLDECALEAVYSEVIAQEFPHGAVPTLAIIDTRSVSAVARGDEPTPRHRRCALLVRPCFLRPAHFERAVNYSADGPHAGSRDAARVRSMFELAIATYGRATLRESYETLWRKWAEQLGYGFVHRLAHGAPSTSNLCFDGRLVDFGSTTAIPTWARVVNTCSRITYGEESQAVTAAIRSLSYFFGRYLDPTFAEAGMVAATIQRALFAYEQAVLIEFLRVFGMSRADASNVVAQDERGVAKVIAGIRRHFRREKLDGLGRMPVPKLPSDIARVWTDDVPPHLQPARELLRRAIASNRQSEAAQVCRFRARPREALYRQELLNRIARTVDESDGSSVAVSRTIRDCIAAGRRDCAFEPENAVPLGFACGPNGGLALFKCLLSGQPFALTEWDISSDLMPGQGQREAAPGGRGSQRHAITSLGMDSIELAGGERFFGSVSICE